MAEAFTRKFRDGPFSERIDKMNEEQHKAIVEIKAAVRKIDADPWLAIALIAVALRDFLDAGAVAYDRLRD